ncbi:MAG: hypothetical protein L0271_19170 [Gemmatimonadetes bacterium]|nr:hypothetical protein [Gemmatimonadota bacterium]
MARTQPDVSAFHPRAAVRARLGVPSPPSLRRVVRLLTVLAACWLPLLLARGTVARVAGMYSIAETGWPWFVPEHAFLLYVLSPLIVLSACIAILTPGLLLAIAVDSARSIDEWVLHGFAASLVVVSVGTAAVQSFRPVGAVAFIVVLAVLSLLSTLFLLARLRRSPPHWPLDAAYAPSALVWLAGVPAILLAVLTPKFYWENFNGDGAHAFEAARLLLQQPVPFWPAGAGEISGFPGLTSALHAYPASWFIRLFGPLEVSARLPYLLYLAALYASLPALTCWGRAWVAGQAERLLLWLSLVVYTVAVSFSATYSPYSADIALPATQDTLLLVCFFGFALANLRRDHAWMGLFAFLTFASLPNGLLLMGFWVVALLLTGRPRRAGTSAIAIAGCLTLAFMLPVLLRAVGLPAPGGEYSGGSLFVRFAFLQVTDWTRALYVIVPCGILPALSMVFWPKLDELARALTIVTAAAFLFAYVQAHSPLHYYIPAMLLPLAVYWRLGPTDVRRWLAVAANVVASLIAFYLVLPVHASPFTDARAVGATIDLRAGDWAAMEPEAFRASTILREILPYDWDADVPERVFGTSPLVLNYYARQPKPPGTVINYVVQRASLETPPGMRPIVTDGEFTVFTRSLDVWNSHRSIRPPVPAGSALLDVPRGVLFRTEPLPPGFRLIDVPALARRLGIDVDALSRRLGVEPQS